MRPIHQAAIMGTGPCPIRASRLGKGLRLIQAITPLGSEFARAFNPKSVAVVGASRVSKTESANWSNPSGQFIPYLLKLGYKGKIYPVNPKADEILGLKCYPSVSAIPEVPDMVTVSVPARVLARVLEDCASAGALNIHVFTSGFSETDTPEGREMEKTVREVATRNGIRVVGPNCLGVHSPRAQFSTIGDIENKSGGAAFVAQSGGHAMDFIFRAEDVGIGVSKVISFGNALVLESADYLEFLGQDDTTTSVGMYIEGVKNGPKLLELVREINPRKPVIIWKGGLSESGSRAAASHTGSLAGQSAIWDAFFRQTGAVRAGSVEEVVDVMQAFSLLPAPRSNRLAMIGSGGGNSVAASDICSQEGLDMAMLSDETSARLRDFIPDAGNSVRNPVDLSFMANVRDKQRQAAEIVTSDPNIDMLLMIPSLSEYVDVTSQAEKAVAGDFAEIARSHSNGKPVVILLPVRIRDPRIKMDYRKLREEFAEAGLLTYTDLRRACRSMAKFVQYHMHQASLASA